MHFHNTELNNQKTERSSHLLEGKDKLFYYSKYGQVSGDTDKEGSTGATSSVESCRNTIIETDSNQLASKSNGQKLNIETENSGSSSSRIGHLKLGFWKLNNINPISRYNFYIDRYNEEINQYKNTELKTIPFNKYLLAIFDFYTLYCRILFGLYLIIFSSISKKYKLDSYKFLQYYNISGPEFPTIWNYEKNRSWIFLILSIISTILNIICFIYFFWIMITPVLVCFFCFLYSFYFARMNKKKIKNNFYRNMVFDEEMDKTSKLNDYILITPGGSEQFLGNNYYTFLLFLYRKRDMTIPQQFMLYGNNYKSESKVISEALICHTVFILISLFIKGIALIS